MAYPTTVIGVGGTGVLAIRYLRHLYEHRLKSSDRVPASFLAVDFDRSALETIDSASRLATLGDDETLHLRAEGIQEFLRNIDRAQDGEFAWRSIREWFPEPDKYTIPVSDIEANGARQLRALGRVGFFLNDQLLESTLRQKLCSAGSDVDLRHLTQGNRVILIGSLAGGTGAGMLIDLAYLARRQAQRPKVLLYLLLPEVFQDVDTGGRTYQNSYAMLKELAYLKDQQLPFYANYPDIQPIRVEVGREEPFARIYLMRGDLCAGSGGILSACESMAKTVLAQLHRTVQERTLALAANTLATSRAEEQDRKRTHCFSTAGNAVIPLRSLDVEPELLLFEALSFLNESVPARGGKRLRGPLLDMLRALEEKVRITPVDSGKGSEGAMPEAPGSQEQEDERDPAADQLRLLARTWQSHIATASRNGAKQTIQDFREGIRDLRAQLLKDGKVDDTAFEEIKGLVIGPFAKPNLEQAESENELLNLLRRRSRSFEALDATLRSTMRGWVSGLTGEMDAKTLLLRWQFFSAILDHLRLFRPPIDPGEDLDRFYESSHREWEKLEKDVEELGDQRKGRLFGVIPKVITMVGSSNLDRRVAIQNHLAKLEEATEQSELESYYRTWLRGRAHQIWRSVLGQLKATYEEELAKVARWRRELPAEERIGRRLEELPEGQREKFEAFLQRIRPALYEQLLALSNEADPETVKSTLVAWIRRELSDDDELQGARFGLPEGLRDEVYRQLVSSRQRVFERRTPNPQRTGFGLVFVPRGVVGAEGQEQLRAFLQSVTTQLLEVRVQIETYTGDELWIYFEDLFNPPDHVWNLDEYYRRYQAEDARPLFHIDRRFLTSPMFREIHSAASGQITVCGNPGCHENIADQPRGELMCPSCARPIRSRCGNKDCHEDELHKSKERDERVCPACGGFNRGSWWQCFRHGKVPVDIPVDKLRCPTCIRESFKDPIAWPKEDISVRPDLIGAVICPRCETLRRQDPTHEEYIIPKPLQKFYSNGVNGHDRERFFELSQRHRLSDKVRCPSCRTILIPIHHEAIHGDPAR